MYRAFFIGLSLILTNCKSSGISFEHSEDNETIVENEINEDPVYINAIIGEYETSLPVDIDSAYMIRNQLILEVKYSGGCGTHDFEFIGSSVVMKTNPPKRTVKLIHKAESDSCQQVIRREVIVDIKELAYEKAPGKEIILILSGYKEHIHYTYE